jgi:hypothetical protein
MHNKLLRLLPALLLLVCAATAQATPIAFFYTGAGSGTLGGVPFTNASFTITALANTANRILVASSPNVYTTAHDSAAISLDGFGELQFISSTKSYVNQGPTFLGGSAVGFGRLTSNELFDLFSGSSFSSWAMLTSIGPTNANGVLSQWSGAGNSDVVTSGGVLRFNDASSVQATFQAIVIPEPGSLCMALVGLSLVGVRRIWLSWPSIP